MPDYKVKAEVILITTADSKEQAEKFAYYDLDMSFEKFPNIALDKFTFVAEEVPEPEMIEDGIN